MPTLSTRVECMSTRGVCDGALRGYPYGMNLGNRIKERLAEKGMKRKELMAAVPDLTPAALSSLIRRGSKRSELDVEIAAALGVRLEWLNAGTGPKEAETGGVTVPESIRTMPRDQVADSVITGMTEMFKLAGISLDHFIPAEELRQSIVEGRRPEVYSVRQILDAIGAARGSVTSGSFARLAINGTQLENVVMKALTGREIAEHSEGNPHPNNTPESKNTVKNRGVKQ